MKFRNLTLSTKFTIAISLILTVFCVIFSVILYYHLKQRVLEDANEKTKIILTQIDAVGDYVNEELRPAVFDLIRNATSEDFIVEAMSTTHVRFSVMRRFNEELEDYVYRRVSINPINPKNTADELHKRLIAFFNKNRGLTVWNGIITHNGQEYLIRAKPVIVKKGCLVCHGKLKDAPRSLVKRYNRTVDLPWKEEDIIGVESVAVPLATTLAEIKGIAISTFVFGIISLFFLFLSLQGAF